MLSRLIYGAHTALLVGVGSSVLGSTLGAALGVVSAYFVRKTGLLLQRFMEIVVSFSMIILALAVVSILGTGTFNLTLAIAIPMVPRVALVVRSSALSIRGAAYADAARALGFSHGPKTFPAEPVRRCGRIAGSRTWGRAEEVAPV